MTHDPVRSFYNRFSFSHFSGDFQRLNPRQEEILALCRRFVRRGDHVLEIGCGSGLISRVLAQRACKVTSLDISDINIALARKTAPYPNIHFERADVVGSDFDPGPHTGRYDVAIMADVIEHIPPDRREELIQRVRKMLRPSGLWILTFPSAAYQRYLRANAPKKLQIIDEIIETDALIQATGMAVRHLRQVDAWLTNQYVHLALANVDGARLDPVPMRRGRWRDRAWRLVNRSVLTFIDQSRRTGEPGMPEGRLKALLYRFVYRMADILFRVWSRT